MTSGRPNCYSRIAQADHESGLESELMLIEKMYALQFQGNWLAINKHNPYGSVTAKRYRKLFYPSLQQARTAQQRLLDTYHIQADIVEIKGDKYASSES